MKLIIDDDIKRIVAFRKALGFAYSGRDHASAMTHLFLGPLFTDIYLDHDGVDGEHIALRIVEADLQRQAKFHIHSSNYVGAVKMRDILRDAGYDVEMVSFEDVVC